MRWIALLLCLVYQQASAQWLRFDVCGFEMPEDDQRMGTELTRMAPTRGPVYIWMPSIIMVTGHKRTGPGPPCTHIVVTGGEIFVIGEIQDILTAINTARGK